jgi:hypothetical protein
VTAVVVVVVVVVVVALDRSPISGCRSPSQAKPVSLDRGQTYRLVAYLPDTEAVYSSHWTR